MNHPAATHAKRRSPWSIVYLIAVITTGILMAGAAGCATTKPWQREILAKPEMAPDGDSDRQALRHHVLSTREGAVGGFGGGGGGCGCN